MRRRVQRDQQPRQFLERSPQASHARINLQVDGRPHTQLGGGTLQQREMPRLPNRGCQVLAYDFFFFAAPEAGHEQNASAHPSVAQRKGFVGSGNPKPARPGVFQRPRTGDGAVAIRIGLHHGTNQRRSNVLLHGAKVVAEVRQRYFRPRGTGRNPRIDHNASHAPIIAMAVGVSGNYGSSDTVEQWFLPRAMEARAFSPVRW